MSILLAVLLLLTLLALGVPVAFSLLSTTLAYIIFVQGAELDVVVTQRLLTALDSFPLLAVPLFIFAGAIMAKGGIAERLMGFADVIVGHLRGGLAQVNVLNSVFIGGMSGSSSADAAIDSKILVPIMVKKGYSLPFAAALTAASSSLSPLLPPSIALIVYGVLANVSIGDLFIGGIGPAVVAAIAMMALTYVISRLRNYGSNRSRAKWREIVVTARRAGLALLMPILLIVGLRMGVFTPTELGAIAVVYALLVSGFAYRTLSWREVLELLSESARLTAMIMFIIASASAFGLVVTYERVPSLVTEFFRDSQLPPLVFLLMINGILLIAGIFLESLSLMIILVPVIAPIGLQLGVDPVHLGVLLVLNFTIGSLTPPVGTVVYTVAAITGVRVGAFARAFFPYFLALVAVLVLAILVPSIVTWLPDLLGG